MENSKLLILLIVLIGVLSINEAADPSGALYLTNYIEAGRYAEAKSLALVNHADTKGLTSYSGFLTVNKQYNSNLFFWFFPAKVNPTTAPVVLWLQGGPGAASIYGLYIENGPLEINAQGKSQLRQQYSWNENHNLVYIDNPVGAGFSYTENNAGYSTNVTEAAINLYSALRQFFTLFSELRGNRFYIAGESYAGKYVPALGYEIWKKRNSADPKDRINLKGISIGNGVTDPINQLDYSDYLYQLGLIDRNGVQQFEALQQAATSYIQQGLFVYAFAVAVQLIFGTASVFNNATGFTSPYNYLKPNGYDPSIDLVSNYLINSTISKALHVGSHTFNAYTTNNVVITNFEGDIMNTVAPELGVLLDNYNVLIYNGQLDVLVGWPLTENYVQLLQFKAAAQYKSAPRQIWRVGTDIAGYYTQVPRFKRALVRNAGHMAPADQPKWLLNLISTLTSGIDFS